MGIERKDWLLLLLGLPDDSGRSPELDRVRLVKCLFVLQRRFEPVVGPEYYHFHPYNYGPFDAEVYRDAEALSQTGELREIPAYYVRYAATDAGIRKARELSERVPPHVTAYMKQLRAWAEKVDFNTLVKAIYDEWPDQRVNSIFQG